MPALAIPTSSSGAFRDARFAIATSPSFAGAKISLMPLGYMRFSSFTHRKRMWPLFTATSLLTRLVTAKSTTNVNSEWSCQSGRDPGRLGHILRGNFGWKRTGGPLGLPASSRAGWLHQGRTLRKTRVRLMDGRNTSELRARSEVGDIGHS